MNPMMIKLLKIVSNKLSEEEITKLLEAHRTGNSSQSELIAELRNTLATPAHFTGSSDLMNYLVEQVKYNYSHGKPTNEAQSQALANTIHQSAINKVHLADYRARHTRLVQVSAIIDPRTTPQCRSMNGRIFAIDDLINEDHNQTQLVRDNSYWEAANHFTGTPTHEIIPSLPPYHFGCRTRIVPYTHGDAYDAFDTMKPTDKLYPTILKDKLANYSITPQNLDTVRSYAHQCQWFKKGDRDSLQEHYQKHKSNLSETINSARDYHNLALAFLKSESAHTCLQFENNSLIMYVYEDMPGSKSGSYKVLVLDLDAMQFKTFSRKQKKAMRNILDIEAQHITKQNIIPPRSRVAKRKDSMPETKETTVEQAVIELSEIGGIDLYHDTIRMHKENDIEEIKLEAFENEVWRTDILHVLINANKLTPEQLSRIKEVDDFILSNDVHPLFQPLKDWLKTNHL